MDNFDHDNIVADEAMGAVKKLASTVGNLAKGARDKSKAKAAQKAADAGQYWTLRAYLKNLIPIPSYIIDQVKDKGISEYAVIQLPEQAAGASQSSIISQLQKLTTDPMPQGIEPGIAALRTSYIVSLTAPTVGGAQVPVGGAASVSETGATNTTSYNFKKFLPWIIGAVLLFGVAYFVAGKKL